MSSIHIPVGLIASPTDRRFNSIFGVFKKWPIVILILLSLWMFVNPLPAAGQRDPEFVLKKIRMHGRSLDLHLSIPHSDSHPNVLVLYGSGDGGWFGAAVEMFEDIAKMGYAVVGFSTRSYLKLLGYSPQPVSVEELSQDYEQIIQEAQRGLALPSKTRTVLTGWSRGAAFAVLVGSEKELQPELAGVVAIGLPDKEELKIRIRGNKILVANSAEARQHVVFDTYERIPEVAPIPLSLIQSTGDDFLPAMKARPLFGVESDNKKFFAIQAHNHRFSGGRQEFIRSLQESLAWICAHPVAMIPQLEDSSSLSLSHRTMISRFGPSS